MIARPPIASEVELESGSPNEGMRDHNQGVATFCPACPLLTPPPPKFLTTSFFRGEENLLFFLQVFHHREGYVECFRHDIRWGEGEPLRQADISHVIALVEFDPDQLFGFGRVFNIMA